MAYLLHQLIDETAHLAPEREAMRFLDQSLSYAELATKSNALANTLIQQGVERRDRVGIYMDKCIELPIAIYGIMKAGAAYVPLDPGAPAERIAFVLRDCGIRHVITGGSKMRSLGEITHRKIGVEYLIGLESDNNLPCQTLSWDRVFAAPGHAPPTVKIIERDLGACAAGNCA